MDKKKVYNIYKRGNNNINKTWISARKAEMNNRNQQKRKQVS